MKKVCYFLSLIALVILPIKVSAEAKLSYDITSADANGVYTVTLYEEVGTDSVYSSFDGTLTAQHAIITETLGTTDFQKVDASSTIDATGTTAHIVTNYVNGIYTGTGEKIKVAEFKYKHDSSYTGDEAVKITVSTIGSPDVEITEKTTPNSPTGSALPYVGIAAGIVLIASAYVISRRSSKLYKI